MTIESRDRYLFGKVTMSPRIVAPGTLEKLEFINHLGGIGREITVLEDATTIHVRHFIGPLTVNSIIRAGEQINNYNMHPKGHKGPLHSIPTTFWGKLFGHTREYRWVTNRD